MNEAERFLKDRGLTWKHTGPYGENTQLDELATYAFSQYKWLQYDEKKEKTLYFLFSGAGELIFTDIPKAFSKLLIEKVDESFPEFYKKGIVLKYSPKANKFKIIIKKPTKRTMDLAIEAIKKGDSFFEEKLEEFRLQLIFDNEEDVRDSIEHFLLTKLGQFKKEYLEDKVENLFTVCLYGAIKNFDKNKI